MEETKLLLGKVDRLEHHFQTYKNDMEYVKDEMKDIKTAIIGNNVNGNKGFLHLVNELDKKVERIEQQNILLEENMKSVKFIKQGFIMGIIGFIFWLFQKN
jgi:chaperonin cofactor prefoldin